MSSYQCLLRFYSEINGGGKNYNSESQQVLFPVENLYGHLVQQIGFFVALKIN